MNSSSIHPVMGIYEPNHQISMWIDSLKFDSNPNSGASSFIEEDEKLDTSFEDAPRETQAQSKECVNQEANKPSDKVQRRRAQNREAARKSRLRKKAYVQQLESSRIELTQLEQELEQFRQEGLYVDGCLADSVRGLSGIFNPGVAAFEMEYGNWVEKQNRLICELRAALQAHISDIELRILVESALRLYDDLFRLKETAARSDVLYLISGAWRSTAERFFLWLGGFRPSELLKVLSPQLDPLTEQQVMALYKLQQCSQQAEDALTQGMDKLQRILAETLIPDPVYVSYDLVQMEKAMGQLEELVSFVNQADNLRKQTLLQMLKILTVRQAARGLLALGDYFQRLRALSLLWAARPQEPV